MDLNNLYNFKNAVRHFVDIDSLEYLDDVENFNTRELCWTMPISFNNILQEFSHPLQIVR